MINFKISILPLLVLSVSNFFVSWLWYSPVLLGKPWMKALGISGKQEMTEEEKKQMPFLFLGGIISSILTVYGMMIIINSLKVTTFLPGVLTGTVIWAGFALTHSLNTLWEGRKALVLVINNGLFLVSYAFFGGILAIWH